MSRIILDTNVLFEPAVLAGLVRHKVPAVLPAVAFAERLRQILRRGGTLEELLGLLQRFHVTVEPFGDEQAMRRPGDELSGPQWARLARDSLIGRHVGPGDVLWTKNAEDFVELGIPREQIHAV